MMMADFPLDETFEQQQLANRHALEASLVERAWSDSDFRQRLLRSPRETIEAELGLTLPPGVEIRVLEETPTLSYLVIPLSPTEVEERELSQEELAAAGQIGFCHITDKQSYGTC
jgi:hypothetical protein